MLKGFEKSLVKTIRAARPNLKQSSIQTYVANLKRLGNMLNLTKYKDLGFLKDTDRVMAALKDYSDNTKRSYVAGIVTALKAMMPDETEVIGLYTNVMNELNVGMMADLKSNKMSAKQKSNWVTVEELKGCVNHWKMRVVADGLLERPFKSLFTSQINTIQKYLISLFLMGDIKENPAMRANYDLVVKTEKEFEGMDAVAKANRNFYVMGQKGATLWLYNYKTFDTYGPKEIKVSKLLYPDLNRWARLNKTGHLLINARRDPLSTNGISKLITAAFSPLGKKIGVSMVRHITITHLHPPPSKSQQETADKMLHSVEMSKEYAKHTPDES